jgi:hypothetical protein
MKKYLQANQERWDQLLVEHQNAPFYDLEGFKSFPLFITSAQTRLTRPPSFTAVPPHHTPVPSLVHPLLSSFAAATLCLA